MLQPALVQSLPVLCTQAVALLQAADTTPDQTQQLALAALGAAAQVHSFSQPACPAFSCALVSCAGELCMATCGAVQPCCELCWRL